MVSIKRVCLQAGVLVFALAFTGKADIFYGVSQTFDNGSVTGTIETDGTLGSLFPNGEVQTSPGAGPILGWDLVLSSPQGPYSINSSNSAIYALGADLTATASHLYINFDPPTYNGDGPDDTILEFQQNNAQLDYYCVANWTEFCGAGITASGAFYVGSDQNGGPLSGNFILGTAEAAATPEPTFLTLTGLGFAGLAFVAYRRRRTV
jgi:hypothetical protein